LPTQQPLSPPPPLLHRQQPPLLRPPPRRPLTSFLVSLLPTPPTSTSGPGNNGPSHPPQTLHTRRTLPYPPSQLYTIIADIDSYRFFLPNCTESRVTSWTSPRTGDQQQPRWPALADLTIGWGPFTQSYTSRVYCIPGSIIEAVSGAASTTIPAASLAEVGYDVSAIGSNKSSGTDGAGIFQSLVTRWTVRAADAPKGQSAGQEWAEVELSIQFRFANPALGFAVGQLADEKVVEMVQAFEERAKRLYGK
ncbi:dehydrase and lipid transport-domain-containing protein, partial [Cercophora newfieldiana]